MFYSTKAINLDRFNTELGVHDLQNLHRRVDVNNRAHEMLQRDFRAANCWMSLRSRPNTIHSRLTSGHKFRVQCATVRICGFRVHLLTLPQLRVTEFGDRSTCPPLSAELRNMEWWIVREDAKVGEEEEEGVVVTHAAVLSRPVDHRVVVRRVPCQWESAADEFGLILPVIPSPFLPVPPVLGPPLPVLVLHARIRPASLRPPERIILAHHQLLCLLTAAGRRRVQTGILSRLWGIFHRTARVTLPGNSEIPQHHPDLL